MKKKISAVKDHVVTYLPEYAFGAITIGMIALIWNVDGDWTPEPEILFEQVTPLGTIQVIAPE